MHDVRIKRKVYSGAIISAGEHAAMNAGFIFNNSQRRFTAFATRSFTIGKP